MDCFIRDFKALNALLGTSAMCWPVLVLTQTTGEDSKGGLQEIVVTANRTADQNGGYALALYFPHSRDRRLRRVLERLRNNPALDERLEDLAAAAGSSPRTLARPSAHCHRG